MLLVVLLFCRPALAAPALDLYYFNPDSVQFNFSLLKKEVDQFFQDAGLGVHFQAFSQQAAFDHQLRERKPALVMVPAWYYTEHGKELALTPLLTPLSNGQPHYSKVLLIREQTPTSTKNFSGKTVASTTMGTRTSEQLEHLFSNGQKVDFSSTNLITTPKDADALFALVLGQVDAAVVGRETIREIGGSNQKILAAVREVSPSRPMPMPMLCVLGGSMSDEDIRRLRQTLIDGGHQTPRPSFMTMLQFDGWQNAML